MKKDFNPLAPWASRLCPGQTYGRNFATRSEVIGKWKWFQVSHLRPKLVWIFCTMQQSQ
jgi:hypothetical protein